MPRVSKPPDERRDELIDAAMELFLRRGYERTAVSDVVRRVGVAQGTFYYHFKSKALLLDAVVDRITAGLEQQLRAVIQEDGESSAVKRLHRTLHIMFGAILANRRLIAFLSRSGNERIHDRVRAVLKQRILPLFKELIRSGKQDGSFRVRYPEETAELLLGALAHLTQPPGPHEHEHRLERLRVVVEQTVTRALGIREE